MNQESLGPFPSMVIGNPKGDVCVFLSGWPDDMVSAWSPMFNTFKQDYCCITLCLPDFNNASANHRKPWGYSFEDLVARLQFTIDKLVPANKQITLCVHDWGAIIGMLYENKFPDRVNKMVIVDVGLMLTGLPPIREVVIIVIYQWW